MAKIYPVPKTATNRLRAAPSTSSKVVGLLPPSGLFVEGVIESTGSGTFDWTRYEPGWVRNDVHSYVSETVEVETGRVFVVPPGPRRSTNFREGPGLSYKVIGTLPPEGVLTRGASESTGLDRLAWTRYPQGWVRNDVHYWYSLEQEYNWDTRFIPQTGRNANRYGGDCGAAAGMMAADQNLRERGLTLDPAWTVDLVAQKLLGLGSTIHRNIYKDGKWVTIKVIKTLAFLDDVRRAMAELAAHEAEIVDDANGAGHHGLKGAYVQLCDYERVPGHKDPNFFGGHYITVFGRTFTSMLYHDPMNNPFVTQPIREFSRMVAYSNYNTPFQGVVYV